jgi:ectoine hydroxylase-related dioxygenase (phytanoyl-CoA dioxygenase family)
MAVIKSLSASEVNWVTRAMQILKTDGVLVVDSIISTDDCARLKVSALRALQSVKSEIGLERLKRAGESGVIRFPLQFDGAFEILLDRVDVLSLVEGFLNQHAICHLMNAILLEPTKGSGPNDEKLFQSQYHRDFPRCFGGEPLSINSFFCLSDFSEQNGATRFLLGSHQQQDLSPPVGRFQSVSVTAPAGSVIVFDSTIWHAGGNNSTDAVRVGVNVQWTYHWIKQQLDIPRLLGANRQRISSENQKRLGFHSQVVDSLQNYYVAQDERLYKSGQG